MAMSRLTERYRLDCQRRPSRIKSHAQSQCIGAAKGAFQLHLLGKVGAMAAVSKPGANVIVTRRTSPVSSRSMTPTASRSKPVRSVALYCRKWR